MKLRALDRPRKIWVEDIEEDIQMLGIKGWRKLSMERMEWRKITKGGFTHSMPRPCRSPAMLCR
jgi:hypothetical protein